MPRSARATGERARSAEVTSCQTVPSPLARTARAARRLPAIAATTRPCLKGSPASGSARRTAGSTASASPTRAGTRSRGDCTSLERNVFSADATFTLPSSVRIAHAQACGPCTSTPFASAMPPSLIFSSPVTSRSRGAAGDPLRSRRTAQLSGGVNEEPRPELEIVHRGTLVRGMDEPRGEIRVHGPHREEAVRDRAERARAGSGCR